MNCKDFELYGSPYIDNMLSNDEKIEFESHINECESCNIKLKNLKTIVESINEVEEVELPITFSSEFKAKLEMEKTYRSKKRVFNNKKRLNTMVAGLLVIIASVALMSNSPIYKNKNNLYSEINEMSEKEERLTFDTASEKSRQAPDATILDETEEDVPAKPRTMSIRNMDEDEEEVPEKDIEKASNENIDEDIEKTDRKTVNIFVILSIIVGIVTLIYKKLKR